MRSVSIVPLQDLAVWRRLIRAQVQISRRLEADLLETHDLALAAYDVLVQLAEADEGRLRMNDLADRVLLSRSGLTRLVDRLQADGLVYRESCTSDARGLYAVLTPAGYERVEVATPTLVAGVTQNMLRKLAADDLRHLEEIVGKLLAP